jgi:predicted ATP-binding protein involved in virulence
MNKDEALEMAIDYLDGSYEAHKVRKACQEALKEEASEQEPIAELVHIGNGETFEVVFDMRKIVNLPNHTKFYTSPQAREWQGLTDDEITGILKSENIYQASYLEFAKAIEQALKEKNTQKSPAERQAEGALNPSPLYPTVNSLEKIYIATKCSQLKHK